MGVGIRRNQRGELWKEAIWEVGQGNPADRLSHAQLIMIPATGKIVKLRITKLNPLRRQAFHPHTLNLPEFNLV